MKTLILGASVRAAAFSTRRAGHIPLGVDLFADRDLVAIATSQRVSLEDYPDRLFETELAQEAEAWFYTGALENSPELVDRLASRVRLLGNGATKLRGVRAPFALGQLLRRSGFWVPRIAADVTLLETDGRWLSKPIQSGGGRGVVAWRGGEAAEESYFQERVEGESLSATYIGHAQGGILRGICEQSCGHPGSPFGYRGSLGPWPVSDRARERLAELGDCIASSFQLRGVFGVDLILRDDEPWTVEVNPRYTASVEVLELAHRRSILAEHFEVFSDPTPRQDDPWLADRFVAKEILFAESPVRLTTEIPLLDHDSDPFAIPDLADIPPVGTCFQAGEPIVTVFGEGTSIEACRVDLERNKTRAWTFLKSSPADT